MDKILQFEKRDEDDYYAILGCDELSTVSQPIDYVMIMLATDLCLSWPKVLNLVTVRGFMKTFVH